jgi:hypothetical protein
MFEAHFDAYLIFLYDGLRCADAPPTDGRALSILGPTRFATRVPKEIDEKH